MYEITKNCRIGNKEYKTGDIVSLKDTGAFYASVMKVSTTIQTAESADDEVSLEKMTVAQLKEYAEQKEIDLGEATKKADILKTIQTAESAE